ncbi:MAG: hypothetical protein AAF614_14950 [Chloroflexota bacterium]
MKDEIWLIRADGSQPTRLLEGDSMPRWSTDGKLIATHQFNVIDVATQTARRLKIDGLSTDAGAASLSPDNNYVLFESDDRNRQAGIARVVYEDEAAAKSNTMTLLLERPAYEPRWSPVPLLNQ